MDSTGIAVANVHFAYSPGEPLFDSLSLVIPAGKITVLLGKSGSGKSTLLQLMNGMIKPFEGEIRISDTPLDYKNLYSARQAIGYVVQHVALFPHLTIHENISILGKVRRWSRVNTAKRVHELMEMVELPEEYLSKYPHELSGGEQQRAGICRALFLNPPVLLMDEPFASLDTTTKDTIAGHLLAIQQKEPRTIVMVSHSWEDAAALADYFIILENGKVLVTGEKSDLVHARENYLKA